jgi:CRP-like cAMP-binding protein
MERPEQGQVTSRLLRALSADDFALLQPHLERVPLEKGKVLISPEKAIRDVVFVESGLGSVIGISPAGEMVEVGLYGFDGLVGMPVVLGTDRSPHELLMQIGGDGWQLPADALRSAMQASQTLRDLLLRYIQFFLVMVAQTAISNAMHTVEERLARWLLMAHDRMADGNVPLTHEYLALMLAVRRPSVTTALHVLEGAHFIRATRGNVQVRDRAAMEEFAGAAYGVPEAEYVRLIGPLRSAT